MIQIMSDYIDQLDLALDQLAYNDRNFDRFALMLIDNVAELLLYQHAKDCYSKNLMWRSVNKDVNDHKLVNKAMGKFFNYKVKLAIKTDLIGSSTGDVLKHLHNFRNSTYHEGVRHEGILHSLAIFYFKTVCKMLSAYQPRTISYSSRDVISHRALKYVGKTNFPFKNNRFSEAFDRLYEVADSFDENMINDLFSDLSNVIESVNSNINFLSEDGPEKMTRVNAIVESQAWHYALTNNARAYANKYTETKNMNVFDLVEWIKINYKKIHRVDPLKSWNRVLVKLEKQDDYESAIKIYCDFLSETENFRNIIEKSAYDLDIHIQSEIDREHGK